LVASTALAQPASDEIARLREARALFERGLGHHDHGEVDLAIAAFEAAWALSQRPSVLLNLGLEYQRAGRLLDALDTLGRFLALPSVPSRQRRVATQAADAVRALLAELTLTAVPPEASVTVDDRAVPLATPLRLLAGTHTVTASAASREGVQRTITLAPGERLSLVLSLPPSAPPPPPPPPPTEYQLVLAGLPPAATAVVDGRAVEGSCRLPPGDHAVSLAAPGYLPWTGVVTVRAQDTTLRARLARFPAPRTNTLGWALTAGAGVTALAAVGLGVGALATHGSFTALTREDPRAATLASRGEALSVAADLTALVALGLGTAAGWWWLRPQPPTPRSDAEIEP
jgi:hypothetical protein